MLCACFQIVICILAPFLKYDLLQEIIHVVVEFLADLMILFLCSAKLVSCALKPNCAGADINKSTKIPPPPPPPIILSVKFVYFVTPFIIVFRTNGNCLFNSCSLSLIHVDSMAIHLHFLTVIELFQHCNKYADHKIFHDAFEGSF